MRDTGYVSTTREGSGFVWLTHYLTAPFLSSGILLEILNPSISISSRRLTALRPWLSHSLLINWKEKRAGKDSETENNVVRNKAALLALTMTDTQLIPQNL